MSMADRFTKSMPSDMRSNRSKRILISPSFSSREERSSTSDYFQPSLIQLGMKIRKSVSEGYKLPKPQKREEDTAKAAKARSDSALVESRKRRIEDDDRDDCATDIDEDEDHTSSDYMYDTCDNSVNSVKVDKRRNVYDYRDMGVRQATGDDTVDFTDAPFLLPKDVIMSLSD